MSKRVNTFYTMVMYFMQSGNGLTLGLGAKHYYPRPLLCQTKALIKSELWPIAKPNVGALLLTIPQMSMSTPSPHSSVRTSYMVGRRVVRPRRRISRALLSSVMHAFDVPLSPRSVVDIGNLQTAPPLRLHRTVRRMETSLNEESFP